MRRTNKPEVIRQAAQHLFLRNGLRETSVDAIAAAARVTKQTVYRYYRGKNELFVDALGGLVAEQVSVSIADAQPDAPVSPAELETRLRTVAGRIVNEALEPTYLALLRVVITEAPQFPDLARHFREVVIERFTTDLTRLLTSQHVAPILTVPSVDTAVRLFIGPLVAYLMEALMHEPDAVKRRAHKELPALMTLLVRAIAAPA
ncbi:TetR/AcrR family transcriptional regulator [Actinophytocola sp.]|uniref:TetR/AcrR family transcriptional regulator n=1 Tax=Actinophytocola sp. TaxID=1872138 RepID=UPI002D7F8815|nr:TetR/AcrR family transcriptional regulator [Actinophytocola sp.]HET9138772.1 TetR/AcrR family transcriptional regulator [Actinophytocola sp.]